MVLRGKEAVHELSHTLSQVNFYFKHHKELAMDLGIEHLFHVHKTLGLIPVPPKEKHYHNTNEYTTRAIPPIIMYQSSIVSDII